MDVDSGSAAFAVVKVAVAPCVAAAEAAAAAVGMFYTVSVVFVVAHQGWELSSEELPGLSTGRLRVMKH